MLPIQLQQPVPNHRGGHILAVHPHDFPARAAGFHHQLHIAVDALHLVGIVMLQEVIVDVLFDLLPGPENGWHSGATMRSHAEPLFLPRRTKKARSGIRPKSDAAPGCLIVIAGIASGEREPKALMRS